MKQIEIKGDKISILDVRAAIVKEEYIQMGKKQMVCHLTLEDGWEVIGVAGVVNPALFNESIGKEISYSKALDKVWLHLGSLLQNKLAKQN